MRVMRCLLVAIVVAGCSKSPPPDPDALPADEVAKLKEAVAKASTTVQARKQILGKVFTSDARIKASSQADTTKTPCPHKLSLPDEATMAAFVKEGKGR